RSLLVCASQQRSPPHAISYQSSRYLRALRSFPTRRSSDLSTPRVSMFMPSVTRHTLPVRSPLPNRQPSIRSAPAWNSSSVAATRSEEHTSELQSRFDLVCRLLLEKKKDTPERSATSCAHTQ